MALHDELAELRVEVGAQVFDDPVAFRAAFDDFVPEGSATTGEVSLLVGAIATGSLERLREQLALGADPDTAIAMQGDLMARDRGTSESSGCRWALSVLAHAMGVVPAEQVLTRPKPGPDSVGTVERPSGTPAPPESVDTGPTQPVAGSPTAVTPAPDATRVVSQEPPSADRPDEQHQRAGRRISPLLVGAGAVLVVVAVTALALLFLRDGDSPDDTAGDASDTSGTTDAVAEEEVLAEIEMSEAGKTVTVRLVHDGTDTELVLLTDRDGELTEVDRIPAGCPYTDDSYDAAIVDEGRRDIYWGWSTRTGDGYGAYGQVQIDDELIIDYGGDEPRDCSAG